MTRRNNGIEMLIAYNKTGITKTYSRYWMDGGLRAMSEPSVELAIEEDTKEVKGSPATTPDGTLQLQWTKDGKIVNPESGQAISANDNKVYADYLGLGGSKWNFGKKQIAMHQVKFYNIGQFQKH